MMYASTLKYFEITITSLEGQVTWAWRKLHVRPISPVSTTVFTYHKYCWSQTIYASRKNRQMPRFKKSQFLPLFKRHINGLTPAAKKNRPKPLFF
jgi:hypothetical protein